LEHGPGGAVPAVKAAHPGQTAMKIKHVALARAAVKVIDVLRDQQPEQPPSLKASQGPMDPIGGGFGHARVAHHASGPVALPRRELSAKGLDLDGLARAPGPAGASIVGDA